MFSDSEVLILLIFCNALQSLALEPLSKQIPVAANTN